MRVLVADLLYEQTVFRPLCRTYECGCPAVPVKSTFMKAEDTVNLFSSPLMACGTCFSESVLL